MRNIRHELSYKYDEQGLLIMQTWKRTSDPAYAGNVENSTYYTPYTYRYFKI